MGTDIIFVYIILVCFFSTVIWYESIRDSILYLVRNIMPIQFFLGWCVGGITFLLISLVLPSIFTICENANLLA